jgi:hypothetical protein
MGWLWHRRRRGSSSSAGISERTLWRSALIGSPFGREVAASGFVAFTPPKGQELDRYRTDLRLARRLRLPADVEGKEEKADVKQQRQEKAAHSVAVPRNPECDNGRGLR